MSNKSYYKAKMKEYQKARDKLKSYKEDLDRFMDNCLTHFKDFNTVYDSIYNLQGEVMENFYSKSETFSKEIQQLFSKIENDISIISNEKSKANDLYEKYRELYEGECKDDNWMERIFD